MHYNHYTLSALAAQLDEQLVGYAFQTCFSQEKDELMLGLSNGAQDFWIHATLTGAFQCLSFPETFFRARRNSIDLLAPLVGKTVLRVDVAENERTLILEVGEQYVLVFKMHGRQANILLFEQDEVIDIFHQKFSQDYELSREELDRPIRQDQEAFLEQGVKKTFPTFGKPLRKYLQLDRLPSREAQWEQIVAFLPQLKQPTFYIVLQEELPELLLFPASDIIHQTTNPIEALNVFYQEWRGRFFLIEEKKQALKKVDKRLRQTKNYIRKAEAKLEEMDGDQRYEEIGHILMANLHQIPAGSKQVELYDFYQDKPITIKLKRELSAPDNAAVYYRKAKNQQIEYDTLLENLEAKEKLERKLKKIRAEIEGFEQVKPLRKFLKSHKLGEKSQRQATPELPFREFVFKGYTIWVGKNAKTNDLLTQRYAKKNDVWLHARSVSGSHVVIRQQNQAAIPQDVIERAAQLAAYYSKRKSEGLCPVIYTPKKYVRKPKGAAPGAVVVEKEQVLMVEPQL